MRVTIYDSFASTLCIDDNWNQLDYPWIFIFSLPFSLYVESLLCNPKYSVFSYTICIHIVIQQTRTAGSEVQHTTLPYRPLILLHDLITTVYHYRRVSFRLVYCIRTFIVVHCQQQTDFEPCNFNCCHSLRSQYYSPSKICKIVQHTDNSVPRGDHSYAPTWDIMNYLQRSHMQGWS